MDFLTARAAVEQQIAALMQRSPLEALSTTVSLQRQVDALLLQAVQSAAGAHSWAEIGSALGISKQAAHQKYVKSVATSLVEHRRAEKRAKRAGDSAAVASAKATQAAAARELRSLPRP